MKYEMNNNLLPGETIYYLIFEMFLNSIDVWGTDTYSSFVNYYQFRMN